MWEIFHPPFPQTQWMDGVGLAITCQMRLLLLIMLTKNGPSDVLTGCTQNMVPSARSLSRLCSAVVATRPQCHAIAPPPSSQVWTRSAPFQCPSQCQSVGTVSRSVCGHSVQVSPSGLLTFRPCLVTYQSPYRIPRIPFDQVVCQKRQAAISNPGLCSHACTGPAMACGHLCFSTCGVCISRAVVENISEVTDGKSHTFSALATLPWPLLI